MKKEVTKELNVEKLNICESDGTIKMSLFNSKNIPSMILEHEDILPGHRANDGVSGIMFYNNEGDECGGLIYGSELDDAGEVTMGMSLTFDKYKQDQVVQLHLDKQGNLEQYGLSIYDRPEVSIRESLKHLKEYGKEKDTEKKNKILKKLQENNMKRIFVGHDADGITKVSLYNRLGHEKIKIYIDEFDSPQIEINNKKISLDKLFIEDKE